MTDYAAAVAAGIAKLDAEKPNWRDLINVDSLRLESCDVCVLGQVFGDYEDGKSYLDIDTTEAKRLGFNTDGDFSRLTQAWKDALGENNILVEKGDVYKDAYGYAVKVLQTHIVDVEDKAITTYMVQHGRIDSTGNFKVTDPENLSVLLKKNFETTYKTKVEKFVPRKGMFVTNKAGQNFYMVNDDEVREIKHGAYARYLEATDLEGMHEMLTGPGRKFSDIVK